MKKEGEEITCQLAVKDSAHANEVYGSLAPRVHDFSNSSTSLAAAATPSLHHQ